MKVPVRDEEIIWRDEPDEKARILEALEKGEDPGEEGWVIIVDDGVIHQLNLMAGEIWVACDGDTSAEEIARDLSHRYDAPERMILEDIDLFVADCVKRGWMREEERP